MLDVASVGFFFLTVVWLAAFWRPTLTTVGLHPLLIGPGLTAGAAWVQSLGYRLRSGLFLAALAYAFVTIFMTLGFAPGGFAAGMLLTCAAGVFYGVHGALLTWLFTGAIYFSGAVLIAQGIIDNPFVASRFDPGRLTAGLRMSASYAAFNALLALSVAVVVARLSASLNQSRLALADARQAHVERERAEAKRLLAEDTAVRSEKLNATAQLAAGVAHDFNNSLQIILGTLDIIPAADELTRRRLSIIASACEDSVRLVRDLQTFAHKDPRSPSHSDLSQLVQQCAVQLKRLLPADIQLEVNTPQQVFAVVDEGQLRQVLANLTLNARDAMPHGGTLTIGTSERGDRALLTVTDTGTGMEEQTRARVFEPFFTTKPTGTGTGLGLAMVQRIVQQHDGEVLLATELGRGSQFEIVLPLANAPSVESQQGARSSVSPAQRYRVLIIDDQPRIAAVVRGMLEADGHEVLEAHSVDQALSLDRETRGQLDLICTDAIMPGTSVRQLLEGLTTYFPKAKALLCSGHIEEDLISRGIEARTIPFLRKPFTRHQLRAEVVRLCSQRRASPPA